MKRLLIILMILMPLHTYAAETNYYKGHVNYRLPDKSALDRIRSDKAFQYEKKERQGNNLVDIAVKWLGEHVFPVLFSQKTRPFWRVLPYLIMAAAIIVVIIMLRRGGISGIFTKKEKSIVSISDFTGDIHEFDFDAAIESYLASGDYRSAVRFRFLKTLRLLSSAEVIAWEKEKTNRDYIYELPEYLRAPFAELVHAFEYVWYGNFSIDMEHALVLSRDFDSFDSGTLHE
jgi:hypothetical protein